jgi:phage protein D
MQVVGGEMHVSARREVRRGTVDLELHSELRRARVVADLAHQVTAVTVSGWDFKQGSRISSTSTGGSLLPGDGRPGAALLRDAFGPRSEHVGDPALATQAEADALAAAIFDRRARPFVCVEGTADGTPALRVGTHVKLSGLGGRFDNSYYVVRVCHRFDLTDGYRTEFEAECAFLGSGA